ncbi:TonB-dependent receptor plug domain-containing protein [Niabella defluvii]|nr:TonB-dependent receptor plug domain-containing protein [Niabella sp. I65]
MIGYQKVTRKKSTASIASISGKEIENLPMSSFDQLMQGRLSGVNVQNFSGDPGARAAVSVRGSSWSALNGIKTMLSARPYTL